MKKAVVFGASGLAGKELVKILLGHPEIEIAAIESRTFAGQKISDVYPEIGFDEKFSNHSISQVNALAPDISFFATPKEISKEIGLKVKSKAVDLSNAFRFDDWPYGLPELFHSSIEGAEKVANPGCYATVCLLSAWPIEKLFKTKAIVFDCKSGVSGAGRESSRINNFNNLSENIFAYNITKHKHVPEIQQFLGSPISFTPHVIPIKRGILCTSHIFFEDIVDADNVFDKMKIFFNNKKFAVVQKGIPDLSAVQYTNNCIIGGFEFDAYNNRMVLVSVIDNLLKGAAGQAIQNMNIMFGFKEEEGLKCGHMACAART